MISKQAFENYEILFFNTLKNNNFVGKSTTSVRKLHEFLKEHKHLISDLYFTCRMPPFLQDAMGDVFESDIRMTTMNALDIS